MLNQYRSPLAMVFLLAACAYPGGSGEPDAAASDPAVEESGSAVTRKWNPGHYLALSGQTFDDALWNRVLDDLAVTPALEGVLVRYTWVDLEPSRNSYDFSHIRRRLASLGDKKMMIFVQLKTFGVDERAVPRYMRNVAFRGGDFPWVNGSGARGGHAPRLMNAAVRDRLKALMSAMAAEFDDDPQIEAIIFPETAVTMYPGWTSTTENAFWAGLRLVNAHRVSVFRRTISCQWVNYPRAKLASFIPDIRDNLGMAIGGPDIVPLERGLIQSTPPNIGAYPHMSMSGGLVPIIYNASRPSYISQTIDGSGPPQSVDDIYRFARDTLNTTHLTWTWVPDYHAKVVQYLQTNDAPLNEARPTHWQ